MKSVAAKYALPTDDTSTKFQTSNLIYTNWLTPDGSGMVSKQRLLKQYLVFLPNRGYQAIPLRKDLFGNAVIEAWQDIIYQ